MENTEQFAQIKLIIANKFNLAEVQPEHCKLISEGIFLKTKNYLSERTIHTIFVGKSRLLSAFCTNSLAQFCGFKDWEDYIEKSK